MRASFKTPRSYGSIVHVASMTTQISREANSSGVKAAFTSDIADCGKPSCKTRAAAPEGDDAGDMAGPWPRAARSREDDPLPSAEDAPPMSSFGEEPAP